MIDTTAIGGIGGIALIGAIGAALSRQDKRQREAGRRRPGFIGAPNPWNWPPRDPTERPRGAELDALPPSHLER